MEKRKDKSIQLSTPWSLDSNLLRHTLSNYGVEEAKLFIKEHEKTKRISLILGVVLILSASALFIYAPAGKETLSYIVGAVLLVFAAGVVGYNRVWGKIPFSEFKADQGDSE